MIRLLTDTCTTVWREVLHIIRRDLTNYYYEEREAAFVQKYLAELEADRQLRESQRRDEESRSEETERDDTTKDTEFARTMPIIRETTLKNVDDISFFLISKEYGNSLSQVILTPCIVKDFPTVNEISQSGSHDELFVTNSRSRLSQEDTSHKTGGSSMLPDGTLENSVPPTQNYDVEDCEKPNFSERQLQTGVIENFCDIDSNDDYMKRLLCEIIVENTCTCHETHVCLQFVDFDDEEETIELLTEDQLLTVETGSVSDWLYRVNPAICLLPSTVAIGVSQKELRQYSELQYSSEDDQQELNQSQKDELVQEILLKSLYVRQWLDETQIFSGTSHLSAGDFEEN